MTTAAQWCRANDAEIERVARGLMRRWALPAAVTHDDVAQELRLGAVLALATFDPSRGVPLNRFLWWQAVQRAKRWMHGQRAALRRSGHAPSEHALSESETGVEADHRGGALSRADDVMEFLEALRMALGACRTDSERACMGALFDARLDAQQAAVAVYADPNMKRLCQVTSPRHARALVRRSAQRLMEVAR